jgi:hypothetical protein
LVKFHEVRSTPRPLANPDSESIRPNTPRGYSALQAVGTSFVTGRSRLVRCGWPRWQMDCHRVLSPIPRQRYSVQRQFPAPLDHLALPHCPICADCRATYGFLSPSSCNRHCICLALPNSTSRRRVRRSSGSRIRRHSEMGSCIRVVNIATQRDGADHEVYGAFWL